MTAARDALLAAVRSALADAPVIPEVTRGYERATTHPDLVAHFAERVADYRADVRVVDDGQLGTAIADVLRAAGARRVAIPADVPAAWLTPPTEWVRDDPPLSHAVLDRLDAVLTGSALAIAETGTIVLDGGPGQGRRALSLLPDHHVCVVRASAVVDGVPAAIAILDPRRPMTWISGPSATSDIELQRVEGVHGPRHLHVLIVTEQGPGA